MSSTAPSSVSAERERLAQTFDRLAEMAEQRAKSDRERGNDHCASYGDGEAYAFRFAAADARNRIPEFIEGIIAQRQKAKAATLLASV
jgi:plasmid stabilization system protein ParE